MTHAFILHIGCRNSTISDDVPVLRKRRMIIFETTYAGKYIIKVAPSLIMPLAMIIPL